MFLSSVYVLNELMSEVLHGCLYTIHISNASIPCLSCFNESALDVRDKIFQQ